VLLLDEPLGALDLKLRKEMQLELKHLNRQLGITFLYVTHDQEEALTMSDRIALMRNGRIEQLDAPQSMYQHPVSKYVADFIGETNILPGDMVGLPVGSWLAVRPEHIRPARGDDPGPTLAVVAREAVFTGAITRLHTTLPDGQDLVLHWPAEDPVPASGSALRVTWPAEWGVRVSE
jgi:ABC-type Fe3+/spermidine/putrescine transport system ATPase subunit